MSIFTRRHYVFLASVCRDQIAADKDRSSKTDRSIKVLADALASESDAFDRQRFMDAIYRDPTIDSMHTPDYQAWTAKAKPVAKSKP